MASDEERRFFGLQAWKWDCMSSFVSADGPIGVVVAAVIAFWEFEESRQAARVAETLNLLHTWEKDEYLAAFRRLDAQVSERLERVPNEDLEAARANPLILERLYERITNEVLVAHGAEEDFENLVYFFQRLSICVEAALCAREPTLAFFRGPMQSFARTFRAEIDTRRVSSPAFANGLSLAE